MTVLHIDSSINGEGSVSRQLAAEAVAKLVAGQPGIDLVYRDLVATPLEHYVLADKPSHETQQAKLSADVLNEFLSADTVVIGAPLYNFTISSQLKSWIDRIIISGVTFRMEATGAAGLVGNKRVILVLSRGAIYKSGSPWAPFEHAETYLSAIFGFIGIVPEFIIAEGVAFGDESRASAIAGAQKEIGLLGPLVAKK